MPLSLKKKQVKGKCHDRRANWIRRRDVTVWCLLKKIGHTIEAKLTVFKEVTVGEIIKMKGLVF